MLRALLPRTTPRGALPLCHHHRRRGIQTLQPSITTPNKPDTPNASATNEPATLAPQDMRELSETVEAGEVARHRQAPNRDKTWSRSQRPRSLAMVGPRFEQTIIEQQPAPWAAIELIHEQPVRWSKESVVSCDGGGGPMGHPRIFINVDRPEVKPCGYCGLPFAHESHRKTITENGAPYPLE